ncbi:MAG: hypothetical protein WBV11_02010 [Salegentibacter sp.]
MKNHLQYLRRAGVFYVLLLFPLIMVNCSKEDTNLSEDHAFQKDFEEAGDLPELEMNIQEFSDPDLGGVEFSTDISEMISQLQAGQLTASGKANLKAIQDFMTSLPTPDLDLANGLDTQSLEAIMNADDLSSDLSNLKRKMEAAPAQILDMLPRVKYSQDYEAYAASTKAPGFSPVKGLAPGETTATYLNGDCYELAKSAYGEKMKELQNQRDAQLQSISQTYDGWLVDCNNRYNHRVSTYNKKKEDIRLEIQQTASQLIAAANNAEASGDPNVAKQIRCLALFFTIYGKFSYNQWCISAPQLLITIKNAEIIIIKAIKEALINKCHYNFNFCKKKCDDILDHCYRSCHNQGSGN